MAPPERGLILLHEDEFKREMDEPEENNSSTGGSSNRARDTFNAGVNLIDGSYPLNLNSYKSFRWFLFSPRSGATKGVKIVSFHLMVDRQPADVSRLLAISNAPAAIKDR